MLLCATCARFVLYTCVGAQRMSFISLYLHTHNLLLLFIYVLLLCGGGTYAMVAINIYNELNSATLTNISRSALLSIDGNFRKCLIEYSGCSSGACEITKWTHLKFVKDNSNARNPWGRLTNHAQHRELVKRKLCFSYIWILLLAVMRHTNDGCALSMCRNIFIFCIIILALDGGIFVVADHYKGRVVLCSLRIIAQSRVNNK